jgi:hypothetical protein
MDRLIDLFKNADDASSWVRVPVVTYLQAAARQQGETGEKAKAAIAELEKIDPGAVKQARTFAAFGGLAAKKVEPQADDPAEPAQVAADAEKADLEKPSLPADASEPAAEEPEVTAVAATGGPTAEAAPIVETAVESETVAAGPSGFTGRRVAVFLVVGLVVLVALRVFTKGAGY